MAEQCKECSGSGAYKCKECKSVYCFTHVDDGFEMSGSDGAKFNCPECKKKTKIESLVK